MLVSPSTPRPVLSTPVAFETARSFGLDEKPGKRSLTRWLTTQELARALRHYACGCAGAEASVELIVRHEFWLTNNDFRDAVDARPSLDDAEEVMACIDWAALAPPPPGPVSAQTVLCVAAALAGHTTATPVTLSALDGETVGLVIRAAQHAATGPRSLSAAVVPPFAVRP